jgi:hypothetical protein
MLRTTCIGLAALSSSAALAQDGYLPLLDDTLSAWSIEETDSGNFTMTDGVLRVAGPEGWLKSRGRYGDFDLRVEFRFVTEAGDSGVFVRAEPDATFGRGWPNRSYQLQLLNPYVEARFPPLGHVFRHGMPAGDLAFDPAVARQAFTAVGEWQTLELTVVGERITARVNGVPLTEATGIANASGHIGIQGETDTLEFRRIDIRER